VYIKEKQPSLHLLYGFDFIIDKQTRGAVKSV